MRVRSHSRVNVVWHTGAIMNRTLLKYGARPVNALAANGARDKKKSQKQRLKKRKAPATGAGAVELARRALERAAWERGS